MRALMMVVLVGLVGCGPADPGWDGGGYTDEEDAPVLGDVPPAPEPDCTGLGDGAIAVCPEGFAAGCQGETWRVEQNAGIWECYLGRQAQCTAEVARCSGTPAVCVAERIVTTSDGTRVSCAH